jgi:hypothetical protein
MMPRNCTFENYREQERTVTEPHFEDEHTLLGARRVVLLSDLNQPVRSRRRFLFSGTFVFAVILGAGVAFLNDYRSQGIIKRVPIEDLATTPAEAGSQKAVGAGIVEQPVQVTKDASISDSVTKVIVPKKSNFATIELGSGLAAHRSRAKPQLARTTAGQNIRQPSSDAMLSDQWQEVRVRRVFGSSERQRAERGDSDLFRTREIFEGNQPH